MKRHAVSLIFECIGTEGLRKYGKQLQYFYHQLQRIQDIGIKYRGGHILLMRFLSSVLNNTNHNQSAETASLDCISATQPV